MVRIMARNEVGVSDPLEPEEPVKMIRPPGNFSENLFEAIFLLLLFVFIISNHETIIRVQSSHFLFIRHIFI